MAARALPSRPDRILSVIGTRPEAIKMAPVISALATRPTLRQQVHRAASRARAHLSGSGRDKSVEQLRDSLTQAISSYLEASPADLVVVQGDTTSALSGALAARSCGVPVAHVEAGLRSHKAEPWPEESNRVRIDSIADLLFAPTGPAAANLAFEPQVTGTVHVTGNGGIDALLRACGPAPHLSHRSQRRKILVTCHRRENRCETVALICTALKRLVAEMPVEIVFPLHLNRHTCAAVEEALAGVEHIALIPPLPYPDMVRLMQSYWVILTDSGGLQEEGPALGRPVLVMRNETERTEAPANVTLVGTEPEAILASVHRLLMDEVHYARMSRPVLPFGDGHAAPRIAILIEDFLAGRAGGRARLAL